MRVPLIDIRLIATGCEVPANAITESGFCTAALTTEITMAATSPSDTAAVIVARPGSMAIARPAAPTRTTAVSELIHRAVTC